MKRSTSLRASSTKLLLLLLLGLAPLSVGCGGTTGETMIHVDPPAEWLGWIDESRGARDRMFREDPTTPLLAGDVATFEGLEYWEPDDRFYFVGEIRYLEQPEQITIITTTGRERPCDKLGWLSFEVGGQAQKLWVYRLADQGEAPESERFFLPFQDGTTGRESYPAGRYVDLDGPLGGPYVLDFNRAYNPSCAYGDPERFACPVTPAGNRLDVRIEAGERGYKKSDA